MNSLEEILSFMDFLDLDEEIIDTRLKSLMARNIHTHKHLMNVIQLLLYKKLINMREASECDNEEEFEFVAKLLGNVNDRNVEQVSKIVNIVLSLNTSSIERKAEHLIQQVLSSINFHSVNNVDYTTTLISLKICDNILDAVTKNGVRLSFMFIETPLENILSCSDEKLKVYFLTNTVPNLFEGVVGYNILDRIWAHILNKNSQYEGLKILSSLSDYYLPVPDDNGDCKYVSEIVLKYEFWDLILFGLNSNDPLIRKISIYLSKKGIECIMRLKKNVNIESKNKTIFTWMVVNKDNLKKMWDNFFILIDSLEEKQSNIVLPSLKLFDSINIGEYWINCAFNMGLKHDNTQIKLKCLEYRLRTRVNNEMEAFVILEALNDINLYDNAGEYDKLKKGINVMFKDKESFFEIFMAIPKIYWSPVPFYHLTDVLSNLSQRVAYENVATVIIDILKVPCNHIVIRKAVHLNVSYFIKNCINLEWRDLANIHSMLQINLSANEENPIVALIKTIAIKEEEKKLFYEDLTETKRTLPFILTYLCSHKDDIDIFINVINEKCKKIQNIANRQYSDKKECVNDVIFLIDLLNKTTNEQDPVKVILNEYVSKQNKELMLFLNNILSSESKLNIKEVVSLFTNINFGSDVTQSGDNILQLYKTSILFIKDIADLDKVVASILVIAELMKNPVMNTYYKHEMLSTKMFLKIVTQLKFSDTSNQSVGRFKNVFYEKSSEILYHLIKEDEDEDEDDIREIVEFIDKVLECGGYGCLNWVLKIANKTANHLLKDNAIFNMLQFINRTWNEIEELKSNNQYTPCIEEFINLIISDAIIAKSDVYNNIILLYCNKIIEYGYVKSYPLHHLTMQLKTKDISEHGNLAFILSEILLYCPVARKDERIVYNVTLEALQDPKLRIYKNDMSIHFNHEIQYLAVEILSKIDDTETLEAIVTLMMNRIMETFKNKKRYHGHSHLHKVLLSTLQHLLILLLKSKTVSDKTLNWSFDYLVKIPHQASVRICFEWFIALHFYIQKICINDQMVDILKSKNVPLLSQFFVMYWLIKHKISNHTYSEEEYNFVLDFLLSNTMGPLFTIRLHAQYFATNIYNMIKKPSKYTYTIHIIERTLGESSGDKNFVKLKNDYFVNEFDIIDHFHAYFIYHQLPNYCDGNNNEKVDPEFIKNMTNEINDNLSKNQNDDFKKEWLMRHKKYEELSQSDLKITEYDMVNETEEISGTIQKKYIPWKNMSNVNVYEIEKKRESAGDLIVVASLIDKLPNLGGMARTSEVFGVKTYVVDSLRHLQDKQFQGLSVSAERWVNVEEVRPGRSLKEYLVKMKSEGYSVVAAEQTSTSCKLHSFKFPKKTLILLGHEKEGVPCDLLPMMDHCVEIPQQGYVRSLNVHVTAAIFVWEYTRQNIL